MKQIWTTVTSLLLIGFLISATACESRNNQDSFITPGSEEDSGVVYGKYSIKPEGIKAQTNFKVAALMEISYLQEQKDKHFILDQESVQERFGTCDKFPLSSEMSAAHCTGVLLKNNVIVTAGHCINAYFNCENMALVFGFTNIEGQYAQRFSKDSVYYCASVKVDEEKDVAYIKLDRKVPQFKKSKVLEKFEASDLVGKSVYSLGYPLGTGLKKTDGFIRSYNEETKVLKTTLDSFDRNSGSPVFLSKTHEFLGILINGEMDFYQSDRYSCQQVITCKENECVGETILTAEDIL